MSVGVLAIGELGSTSDWLTSARMAKRLSEHVTIYTDDDETLSEQLRLQLDSNNIEVESRTISRLESKNKGAEVVVHFDEGASKVEDIVVCNPTLITRGPC
jgi:hypothetical protein